MATDFKLFFYIKKTEVKADGTCPIMGRISIGKTMVQFSTKQTARVSLWDTRANRMSGKSTTAVIVNRALDKLTVSINSYYQKLIQLNGSTIANDVKNAFQGVASVQHTLVKYYQNHNQEFFKRVGINREKNTALQYEISLNHIIRFLRKKYNVSDVPFSKLDLTFIEAYDFYLRVELKLKSNTILGIVRHIQKMIKLAIAEGIIDHKFIYHAGRHTYATEICLSQGVPIESVSRMLEHRDLRSTQIYAKIMEHKIAEDMQRAESRIEDKNKKYVCRAVLY